MKNKKYLDLIVPEHRKPKLLQWLSCLLEKIEDIEKCAESIDICFDLDIAQGKQLDILGELVGRQRELTFQPEENMSSVLEDNIYRTVIRAKIGINHWNGTIPSIYILWQNLFPDYKLHIKDNQDMSMNVTVVGDLTSLEKNLVHYGYIVPRPEGVKQNTETASELPLPQKTLYVGGAVFRPISETTLAEIEYNYQFKTVIQIGSTFQNIMETTLPELEFKTSAVMNVVADWCEIEQTTLPEMKI